MNDPLERATAEAVEDPAPAAARLLWRHWSNGTVITALPSEIRPTTRAAGYAVQAQLPVASKQAVAGWKIAATSAAGQAHIGVTGPLAGRLLSGRISEDGASLPLSGNRMRVAEPEFAFRFARTLQPRRKPYETQEVLAAVADLHPSIEVPDSRYADFVSAGEAQLLADNACAGLFVLGPPAAAWRQVDLAAHPVRARVEPSGAPAWQREGRGSNVLGDPLAALTWLVNEVSTLGWEVEAGAVVTTGTCMPPLQIGPGDAVLADFGPLGRVSVHFRQA